MLETSWEEKDLRRLLPQKCQKTTLETLITFMIELLLLKGTLRSMNRLVPLKKKMMTSETLQVKRGDLHMTVKMAFNRFLRAELSAQEKKEDLSEGRIRSLKSLVAENTKTPS